MLKNAVEVDLQGIKFMAYTGAGQKQKWDNFEARFKAVRDREMKVLLTELEAIAARKGWDLDEFGRGDHCIWPDSLPHEYAVMDEVLITYFEGDTEGDKELEAWIEKANDHFGIYVLTAMAG